MAARTHALHFALCRALWTEVPVLMHFTFTWNIFLRKPLYARMPARVISRCQKCMLACFLPDCHVHINMRDTGGLIASDWLLMLFQMLSVNVALPFVWKIKKISLNINLRWLWDIKSGISFKWKVFFLRVCAQRLRQMLFESRSEGPAAVLCVLRSLLLKIKPLPTHACHSSHLRLHLFLVSNLKHTQLAPSLAYKLS